MAIIRLSGKRALSQLNAFDFVVTVTGTRFWPASYLLATSRWPRGVITLALLLTRQYIVTSLSVRWPRVRNGITVLPALLLEDGRIQYETLRPPRLTESELRQAVRESGTGDLSKVKAVILERNGTLSVIAHNQYGDGSAMQDVPGTL